MKRFPAFTYDHFWPTSSSSISVFTCQSKHDCESPPEGWRPDPEATETHPQEPGCCPTETPLPSPVPAGCRRPEDLGTETQTQTWKLLCYETVSDRIDKSNGQRTTLHEMPHDSSRLQSYPVRSLSLVPVGLMGRDAVVSDPCGELHRTRPGEGKPQ